MQWERAVLDLIDDLEQQAEGLALRERDALVADLSRGEYATVNQASRWHASVGVEVRVDLLGDLVVRGQVTRTGRDWALVAGLDGRSWLLRQEAVRAVLGLSGRSLAEEAAGAVRHLGIRPVLRRLADVRAPVQIVLIDGARLEGPLLRVGGDFMEVQSASGPMLVPFGSCAAVVGQD